MHGFDLIAWAPGATLLLDEQGRPMGTRAAVMGLKAEELLDGRWRTPVFDELVARLRPGGTLLLVGTDQPTGETRRTSDTAPAVQLLATAATLFGARLREGLAQRDVEVLRVSGPIDVAAAVSDLLDDPIWHGHVPGAQEPALVQGGGPGPLQLAVALALAATRPEPVAQLSVFAGRSAAGAEVHAGTAALLARVSGLEDIRDAAALARELLFDEPAAARATLRAAARNVRTLGDPEADRLRHASWIVDLDERLSWGEVIGDDELAEAAREAETTTDMLAGPTRMRARGHTDLAAGRLAEGLARAGLALGDRSDDGPASQALRDAAGLPARRLAVRADAVLRGATAVAAQDPLREHAAKLLEGLAAGGQQPAARRRRVAIFVFGSQLDSARPPRALRELLAAAAPVELDALQVVGLSQEDGNEQDTANVAVDVVRSVAEAGLPGVGSTTAVELLALHANPADAGAVADAVAGALARALAPGDDVRVLQHGAAPAVVNALVLGALARRCEATMLRTVQPQAPDDPLDLIEQPVARLVRRGRRMLLRRLALQALLAVRAAAGLRLLAQDLDDDSRDVLALAVHLDAEGSPFVEPAAIEIAGRAGLPPSLVDQLRWLSVEAAPLAARVARRWPVARAHLAAGRPALGAEILGDLLGQAGEHESASRLRAVAWGATRAPERARLVAELAAALRVEGAELAPPLVRLADALATVLAPCGVPARAVYGGDVAGALARAVADELA